MDGQRCFLQTHLVRTQERDDGLEGFLSAFGPWNVNKEVFFSGDNFNLHKNQTLEEMIDDPYVPPGTVGK